MQSASLLAGLGAGPSRRARFRRRTVGERPVRALSSELRKKVGFADPLEFPSVGPHPNAIDWKAPPPSVPAEPFSFEARGGSLDGAAERRYASSASSHHRRCLANGGTPPEEPFAGVRPLDVPRGPASPASARPSWRASQRSRTPDKVPSALSSDPLKLPSIGGNDPWGIAPTAPPASPEELSVEPRGGSLDSSWYASSADWRCPHRFRKLRLPIPAPAPSVGFALDGHHRQLLEHSRLFFEQVSGLQISVVEPEQKQACARKHKSSH